jgi:hypothetical protein
MKLPVSATIKKVRAKMMSIRLVSADELRADRLASDREEIQVYLSILSIGVTGKICLPNVENLRKSASKSDAMSDPLFADADFTDTCTANGAL